MAGRVYNHIGSPHAFKVPENVHGIARGVRTESLEDDRNRDAMIKILDLVSVANQI